MVIFSHARRLATIVALAPMACREQADASRRDVEPRVDTQLSSMSSASARVESAPLRTEWIEKTDLPDGGLAYITPPVGATSRRPIVVGVHGAVDDPGLMCSAWRLVTDVYPFVV